MANKLVTEGMTQKERKPVPDQKGNKNTQNNGKTNK